MSSEALTTARALDRKAVRIGPLTIDESGAVQAGDLAPLTPRERELLRLLAFHYPRAVAFKDISRSYFGTSHGDAEQHTITVVASRLRTKVRATGLDVINELNYGYRLKVVLSGAAA